MGGINWLIAAWGRYGLSQQLSHSQASKDYCLDRQ